MYANRARPPWSHSTRETSDATAIITGEFYFSILYAFLSSIQAEILTVLSQKPDEYTDKISKRLKF